MEIVISYRFFGAESKYDNQKLRLALVFWIFLIFIVVQMHTLMLMQQQKRACSQSLFLSFLAVRQVWLISSKSPTVIS